MICCRTICLTFTIVCGPIASHKKNSKEIELFNGLLRFFIRWRFDALALLLSPLCISMHNLISEYFALLWWKENVSVPLLQHSQYKISVIFMTGFTILYVTRIYHNLSFEIVGVLNKSKWQILLMFDAMLIHPSFSVCCVWSGLAAVVGGVFSNLAKSANAILSSPSKIGINLCELAPVNSPLTKYKIVDKVFGC